MTATQPAANGTAGISAFDVLTLAEAAAYLRLPADEIRAAAAAGRIAGRPADGDWRFPRESLIAWLKTPRPAAGWSPPAGPWAPDREAEVEAEIAELYARRRSDGTVGDLQDAAGSEE